MAVAGGVDGAGAFQGRGLVWRSQAICGARRGDGTARGFVPWIYAVAEEERDPARWERERKNPKRLGEFSQAPVFGEGAGDGIWTGAALGRQREV